MDKKEFGEERLHIETEAQGGKNGTIYLESNTADSNGVMFSKIVSVDDLTVVTVIVDEEDNTIDTMNLSSGRPLLAGQFLVIPRVITDGVTYCPKIKKVTFTGASEILGIV